MCALCRRIVADRTQRPRHRRVGPASQRPTPPSRTDTPAGRSADRRRLGQRACQGRTALRLAVDIGRPERAPGPDDGAAPLSAGRHRRDDRRRPPARERGSRSGGLQHIRRQCGDGSRRHRLGARLLQPRRGDRSRQRHRLLLARQLLQRHRRQRRLRRRHIPRPRTGEPRRGSQTADHTRLHRVALSGLRAAAPHRQDVQAARGTASS